MLVMQWWKQINATPIVQKRRDQPTIRIVSPMDDDAAAADLAEQIVLFVYLLLKQTGTKQLTIPYVVSWDSEDIRLQMGINDEALFTQAWFWAQNVGWIARANPFGTLSHRPEASSFEIAPRKRDYLQ